MIDVSKVEAAAARIAPYVHRTPVMHSETLDTLVGVNVYFKSEHLQKSGSFKARGAMNFVLQLSDAEKRRGVATHSSGNHGAALARAAALLGIPAYVVVPSNAPEAKLANISRFGATIVSCEPTLAARVDALNQVVREHGAIFAPPYNHEHIIAGQGTAALELLEEMPGLDHLLVPVGGGGLLAGTLLASEGRATVYGTEPEGADDAFRSLKSGNLVLEHQPNTQADGLQTTLGELNFSIIQVQVADILLVNEAEITEAMKLVWQHLKQVIEPSSAVPLAAAIRYRDLFSGKKLGIILSGGNRDFHF